METQTKLTHGGKRNGAGRPVANTIRKTYKLKPETIEQIRQIAEASKRSESAVAEEYLSRMSNPTLRLFVKPTTEITTQKPTESFPGASRAVTRKPVIPSNFLPVIDGGELEIVSKPRRRTTS